MDSVPSHPHSWNLLLPETFKTFNRLTQIFIFHTTFLLILSFSLSTFIFSFVSGHCIFTVVDGHFLCPHLWIWVLRRALSSPILFSCCPSMVCLKWTVLSILMLIILLYSTVFKKWPIPQELQKSKMEAGECKTSYINFEYMQSNFVSFNASNTHFLLPSTWYNLPDIYCLYFKNS